MILLGLTGSIGMGKSTTAALFAAAGAPVFDADAAVHRLYAKGGAAVPLVDAAFPGVVAQGAVDRAALGARVLNDPAAMRRLEALIHPLVGAERGAFLADAAAAAVPVAVFDVPLLFETGGDKGVGAVVVVSCDPALQRGRVLERPGMTAGKLDAILARQTPDAEKRARADFVIDTGHGLEPARRQVMEVLHTLSDPAWRSTRPR